MNCSNIFIYFVEILLIDNVVLVSAVQQSDSVTHIYRFFSIFFSIMIYLRMSNRVPCAIIVYPFYCFLKNTYLFTWLCGYLAVLSLSCSTQDVHFGVKDLFHCGTRVRLL